MKQGKKSIFALFAAGAMLVAACGDDEESSDTTTVETTAEATEDTTGDTTGDTTAETTPGETTPATDPSAEAWAVDTSMCVDPDLADAPIEGTLKIGSVFPLTGGVAASAFAPIAAGLKAYIDYANEKGLLGDLELDLQLADDQYNAELTSGAVASLMEADVDMFTAIVGTPSNLAVRDTLNDNCYPQLLALTGSPDWAEPVDYPWTTGALTSYTVESKIYAGNIAEQFPDGAKVALFHVNNEFGQVFVDAFNELADDYGIDIVADQTIEAIDQTPPTAQLTNIAAEAPDAIMAAPLGAQCISFLTELANAKAVNAGWDPKVYISSTCALGLILDVTGPAADGLYTSANGYDFGDPANQEMPQIAEFFDVMEARGESELAISAAAGWWAGEITVAIIKQAMNSPEGLTRASIINAARNFEYVSNYALPGVVFKMNGEADAYMAESLIVRQWHAYTKTFTDVGELVTQYETL